MNLLQMKLIEDRVLLQINTQSLNIVLLVIIYMYDMTCVILMNKYSRNAISVFLLISSFIIRVHVFLFY